MPGWRVTVCVVVPSTPLTELDGLDVGSLCGVARSSAAGGCALDTGATFAGVLMTAADGLLVMDARAGLYAGEAWLAIKRALLSGRVVPIDEQSGRPRFDIAPLPLGARLVIVGDGADCRAWHQANEELAASTHLVVAFEPTMVRTPGAERTLAGHLQAITAIDGLAPLSAAGWLALFDVMGAGLDRAGTLSTDLDVSRSVLRVASARARLAGRANIEADDVTAGWATRRELQDFAPALGGGA
jgi:predicted ATP-dependent protease